MNEKEVSKVALMQCNEYDLELIIKKINEGIEILGGWEKYIKPNSTVLLKPNMISPKKPETAITTHPVFLQAMIRILKSMNCIVWIGDSSGGLFGGTSPTKQSFIVTGYAEIAEKENAVIKNFDMEGTVKIIPNSGLTPEMNIAKPMFEADYVINLPKLKTHVAALYTGAMKNLFGCIPGLKKAEYHKIGSKSEDFANIIVDINEAVNVTLNIMDAIVAMDGDGPTGGNPYEMHKILISDNALALDMTATKMINVDAKEVPILKAAINRKFGPESFKDVYVDGDYEHVPTVVNFKLPRTMNRLSNSKLAAKIMPYAVDFTKSRPKVNLKSCKQCNMCVNSCPVEAINIETKEISYDKCIECMCCHELCLYHAVELKKLNPLAGMIKRKK